MVFLLFRNHKVTSHMFVEHIFTLNQNVVRGEALALKCTMRIDNKDDTILLRIVPLKGDLITNCVKCVQWLTISLIVFYCLTANLLKTIVINAEIFKSLKQTSINWIKPPAC